MIQRRNLFNSRFRTARVGPGGWLCTCCGPSPKHRKAFIRRVKRGNWKKFLDAMVRESLEAS